MFSGLFSVGGHVVMAGELLYPFALTRHEKPIGPENPKDKKDIASKDKEKTNA